MIEARISALVRAVDDLADIIDNIHLNSQPRDLDECTEIMKRVRISLFEAGE